MGLSKKLEAARAALNDTKAGLGRALTYEDLHSGVLRRHFKTFTYFPTAHINDVFLEMLNFKSDGPEDPAVCTRLIRYRVASSAKRLGVPPPQFPGGRRPRKLDYKTEHLVYSIYVHGGLTEEQLAALFDIDSSVVSDFVHTGLSSLGATSPSACNSDPQPDAPCVPSSCSRDLRSLLNLFASRCF